MTFKEFGLLDVGQYISDGDLCMLTPKGDLTVIIMLFLCLKAQECTLVYKV